MIVYKLTSSKECVEQFYSNTGLQTELTDDDIRLWTAEIVELIGYPLQYIPKVIGHKQDSRYEFDNYSVPLPCDFHKLIPGGISVNGNQVRFSQASFHYLMAGDCCDLDTINNSTMDVFIDQFGNEFSPQASTSGTVHPAYQDVTFQIHDGRIVFNVKQGRVCLAYWSQPFDNEGYVMIPDTAKYKRAVTDYLIWKNDYILWRQGSLSDKVYAESRENKDWSISSASMEMKVPDVEQMEVIKNGVTRLLPMVNEYNKFFKSFGTNETRRFR